MSDPVKAKSTFLCMYMSGHPDTLVSYAKYYGKLKAKDIVSAKMESIDSKVCFHFISSRRPSLMPPGCGRAWT